MLSFIPSEKPRKSLRPSEAVVAICELLPAQESNYQESKLTLFRALQDGRAVAHVHLFTPESFYRVPTEYWTGGDFWDLRLSDRLFAWAGDGVPLELDGKDVVLDGDSVQSMLSSIRQSAPKPKAVSTDELRRWLKEKDNLDELSIDRELWPAAQAHFPDNHVSKRQVRFVVSDISGPRKPGRKSKRAAF